jgi:hypothetical protein
MNYAETDVSVKTFVVTVPTLGPKESFWLGVIAASPHRILTNVRSDTGRRTDVECDCAGCVSALGARAADERGIPCHGCDVLFFASCCAASDLDLRRKLATEAASEVNLLFCLLPLPYAAATMEMTTPVRNAVASVKADRAAIS